MTLIERIKRLFHIGKKVNNDIEPIETTDVSIIDTSNIEIDRNLTDDENESRKKLFEEVSSGNFSTFITYGNDIARKTNHYMDIIRKRLNQNIEENKTLSRNVSLEQAIRQKVKIIFNNAEIDSILNDLSELKRNCELRIIALEDLGNVELKKSKRRIFFMSDKTDASKIKSINNAISRLSAHIKIINMLSHSVRNEQLTYYNENNTLNTFLSSKDEQESKKIANKVLDETFKELKSSIKAMASFSNIPALVIDGESLDKLDMDNMSLDKKVEVIALSKKYLDLYVAENREKLLEPGGLLDRAKEYQSKLWEEIESDYLDVPLWAKKAFHNSYIKSDKSIYPNIENRVYHKYYERLDNIERLVSVFGEEVPEDFKEKFYKTKFYYYALYNETNNCDSFKGNSYKIKIKNEEERQYYLKLITEMVDKIHRESEDGELLKFMDKHLSLKNVEDILEKYNKLTALLRIEKYGRDGLFTLMFYLNDLGNETLQSCLDQINSKKPKKIKIMPDNNSNKMAKDILAMWKSTENLSTMYNGFWGDYNDGWDFAERVKDGLYPRSSPEIYGIDYSRDYIEFLVKTIKEYNKSQREVNVPLESRFYFDSELNIRLHIGQYMAMFSYLIEKLTEKNISKESVLAQIKSPNGKLEDGLNYSQILRKILPDLKEYMHSNLTEGDYKNLYEMMRKDYIRGTINTEINFYRLLFKDYKADDGKVLGEDFNYDKYKYYKSIINICKSFYKAGLHCWGLALICLELDKDFGKKNVKNELLNNYNIKQDEYREVYDVNHPMIYRLDFYNKVNSLRYICEERIDDRDDINIEKICFNSSIEFFVLNRLVNEEILANSEEYRIALYIAEYYREALNGQESYKSILDDGFDNFYMGGLDIEGRRKPFGGFSGMKFRWWLTYDEKRRTPIPKDYQKVYELYKRIRAVFKSTDNIQEILCPDLVKIIMTKDFYKRLGKSYDKNKKIRQEILFEGYRKNAEVKDDRENTAKSDDIDLTFF